MLAGPVLFTLPGHEVVRSVSHWLRLSIDAVEEKTCQQRTMRQQASKTCSHSIIQILYDDSS